MLTTRPTHAPDQIGEWSLVVKEGPAEELSLFFDDLSAVMYRKIDTTPLSATFPQYQVGSGVAAGISSGSWGLVVESDRGRVVSSLIPSRMTHRPLFALAGAPSERMKP